MQIKESVRKYILMGMVLLVLIGLITAKVLEDRQNNEFLLNEQLYNQTIQLFTDENYEEAILYSAELLKRVPNSEVANYLGGLIASLNQDYKQAAILLQKTLDINPHKVEDPMFMIQFGEALVFAEREKDAKIILEKCRDMGWAPEQYPEYQERVAELLTQISAV